MLGEIAYFTLTAYFATTLTAPANSQLAIMNANESAIQLLTPTVGANRMASITMQISANARSNTGIVIFMSLLYAGGGLTNVSTI